MKFSSKIIEELTKAIRDGSSQKDACVMAGISVETFHQWRKNKPEFSVPLEKAELECKNRNIKIIQKAAITTWQAAAWWLERRYFSEYGLRQSVSIPELSRFVIQRAPDKKSV